MKDMNRQFIKTFMIGSLLLLGIVILINSIFGNINIGRFDLTADRIYRLSPSAEKILANLEAPIEITYYVSSSEKMPTQWKNLERDVIDKLRELKLASRGRLSYTIFDPSAEEEREAYEAARIEQETGQAGLSRKRIAERLYDRGVIPFGVQSTDRDEFAVKRVYSSLVLSYLDRKEEVIEEVRPETFGSLEYEIMSRIFKLISNRRPKVGFYPGQPEIPPQYRQYYQQTPPDMYEFAVQLLRESGYDVIRTNITRDDPVPDDIQTMVMMVDQPLNERQMYEIDKLVHRGVGVILAAQTYNYQISPSREPGSFDLRGMPSRLNINRLTVNWGFEFDQAMFMDRSSAYIQIPVYQTRSMGALQVRQQRMEPVTKPVIIKIQSENINTDLSISNKISELFYMYGGRLLVHQDLIGENDLKVRTLFTSSGESWVRQSYGYGPVDTSPPDPRDRLGKQPLAVYIEGRFNATFTDSIPSWEPVPGTEEESPAMDSSGPSELTGESQMNRMIVTGCSNLFKNDVLQSVASHKALLLNSVDVLTLGEDLIHIRSKNISSRKIKEISSAGKAFSKAFAVWFTPILFAGFGLWLNMRRKKQ